MKAEDIIDLLPIVADRAWRIEGSGIVRDSEDRCPVCALVYELSEGQADWYGMALCAMEQIGVCHEYEAIRAVMDAADNIGSQPHRSHMLRALGLAG